MGTVPHFRRLAFLTLALAMAQTLVLPVAWADPSVLSQPFNQAREFPNYFLPEKYRARPAAEIPPEVIAKQQELLDRALGSVFDRMIVPVVPEDSSEIRQVRYFPYLREQLLKVDPEAKVYASGGVVRTAISYLYDEIYRALEADPARDPNSVLEQIASSKEDLPAIRVRGIGSDMDVLIRSSDGSFAALQKKAYAVTNSASQSMGVTLESKALRNSLFTVGDVREYERQIERSTRQGGSVVDYLAFDTGAGKLIDPPRFPNLSQHLIEGRYEYAPPVPGAAPEDLGDSVVRGYRTLIELPWLKLENPQYLSEQIKKVEESTRLGKPLSARALSQFGNGVRNSRYFGAHNRIYRGQPGSPEAQILELAAKLGEGRPGELIPEFADAARIESRSGDHAELRGLSKNLLMPVSDFKKQYTRDGILYHGTPSVENSLAILRQGLFLSNSRQGTAAFGRGVYSTPVRKIAESFASARGLVFELELKDDPRINILDWKKVESDPEIQKLVAEAHRQGRDPFEFLSREHGIDIIVNQHVLIQNSDAVRLPNGFRSFAENLGRDLARNPTARGAVEYVRMGHYLEALGDKPLPPLENAKLRGALELVSRSSHYGADDYKAVVQTLVLPGILRLPDSQLKRMSEEYLHDRGGIFPEIYTHLGLRLFRLIQDPALRKNLVTTFTGEYSSDYVHSAFLQLASERKDDPAMAEGFAETLLTSRNAEYYDAKFKFLSELPEPEQTRLFARALEIGRNWVSSYDGSELARRRMPRGFERNWANLVTSMNRKTPSPVSREQTLHAFERIISMPRGEEASTVLAGAYDRHEPWAEEVAEKILSNPKIPVRARRDLAGKIRSKSLVAHTCVLLFFGIGKHR